MVLVNMNKECNTMYVNNDASNDGWSMNNEYIESIITNDERANIYDKSICTDNIFFEIEKSFK